MEQPFRDRQRVHVRFRYRAPAVATCAAVSTVLSLLGPGSSAVLDTLLLRPGHLSLEGFVASHLFHPHALYLAPSLLLLLTAGGVVESRWGSLRYIAFHLFVAWGTTAISLIFTLPLERVGPSCGAAGVGLGTLVIVGLLYPEHRLFPHAPPLKLLVWCLVFLGAAGLAYVPAPPGAEPYFLLPQVAGVAFAMAFVVLEPALARAIERRRQRRREAEQARVGEIRQRVDRLLEKISTCGYSGLTRDEQQFLRQASQYFRQD